MTNLSRKLIVEFIGAFFLMFTIGMAVATAGTLAPLAIGASLMVMVFAGGHISGGHYNPAVSTAAFFRGALSREEYPAYIVVQAIGAICAGLLVSALGYAPATAGAVAGAGKMLIVEFLFTFALCYVVLNVATAKDNENNSFYGLAIGFTVAVGAFAVGKVSGGAFNPAVALGASVEGMFSWSNIWVYLLAEFVAGAVAAGVFLATQPAERPEAQMGAAQPEAGNGNGQRDLDSSPRSVSRVAS
jgi:aquaporin Z